MKFHTIEIDNLNSLYGAQTIDFDRALGQAALFLIMGPTGAGKSTILDAVCLALFGETPRLRDVEGGRKGVAEQIMSWGEGSCRALVEFSVRADGGRRQRYRAEWTSRRSYDDPDGNMQEPQRALWRMLDDGQWKLVVSSHRAKDYEPHFDRILHGMSADDFLRSVLLAQGDFTAFLKASEEEKASILERLTDTSIYKRIGQRASRRRRQAQAEVRRLDEQLAGLDVLSAEAVDAMQAELAEVEADVARKKAVLEGAREDLGWLEQRGVLAAERDAAQKAVCAAVGQLEAHRDDVERLQAAQLPAEVVRLLAALEQAEEEAADAVDEAAAAADELAELQAACAVEAEACEAAEALLATRQETAEARADALEELRTVLAIVEARELLDDDMPCPVCGSCEHPLADSGALEAQDDQTRERAREMADQLALARQRADAQAERVSERQQDLAAAEAGLAHQAERLAEVERRLEARQDTAFAAHQAALDQLGGEAELEQVRQAMRVDPAELAELRAQVEGLEQAVVRAEQSLADATVRLERHEAACPKTLAGAEGDTEAMRARVAALDDEHRDLVERAGKLKERLDGQRALRDERDRLTGERDRLRQTCDLWETIHRLIGVGDGERFKLFAQALNLRDMVRKANHHLGRLHERYRLDVAIDDEGYPQLDFAVRDRCHANAPRPLATLSGGETFLVSLALALALADYRQLDMPIETLLLDEGFATLDQASLNQALAILKTLHRDGHRQVGIISHVESLKEQVDDRIRVERVAEGRSKVVVGG